MGDEELMALIEKHGLSFGMKTPMLLRDNGDGTMSFYQPNELTIYGKKMLAFAKEIIERMDDECAERIDAYQRDLDRA